jgi:putative ABC transport system permease protein
MSASSSKPFLIGLTVLVLIIALGELFALFLDYQNNGYLQQYVSNNSSLILEQTTGLLLSAAVLGFLAYKIATARPTGRIGRASHRMTALSPIIAGLIALVLWFSLFSSVFGGSLTSLEAYAVAVLLFITVGMMARDRITVRMSFRNFTRRKTSMAIVIAGLMIGTAMISGSLVTGDTLSNLFTRGAYNGYGYADEVVYTQTVTGFQFFNISYAHSLYLGLSSSPTASPYIRGVTPEVLSAITAIDKANGVIQSGATLIGEYNNASQVLGDFHASDGSVIPFTISDSQAIINDRAARDLNATVGDQLNVFLNKTVSVAVNIVGIAVSDSRGDFSQGDNIFVTMNTAQVLTAHPGSVNYVAITNTGGLRGSIQYTSTVGLAANQTLNNIQDIQNTSPGFACKTSPNTPGNSTPFLCAYGAKMVSVNSAMTGAQSLSNLFTVLSTITILAGVVLIINMFIMLAEERKSEMGMARAVGMKRGQLTKLFLFEGTLYAAGSSLVGIFVGIGIAYGILYAFGKIISNFFPVSLAQVLDSFTFTPTSLFTAFTEGLFITYVTILLTSWRVSRLNIIRAVRDIPEPPKGVRTYTKLSFVGIALAILGILVFDASFAAKSAIEALVGPSLVIFGAGLVLARFLLNRYAFTITGLALLVQWGVPSFSFDSSIIQNYSFGPEILIVGGMFMVAGAILLALYNTDVILKILRVFYQGRKRLTVIFKTALSYPSNKRFRTGATVAMFALVLLSVTTIAFLTAEQTTALNKIVAQQSGGYDIVAETQESVTNLPAQLNADPSLSGKVAAVTPFNTTEVVVRDITSGQDFPYVSAVGADPNAPPQTNFFTGNTFQIVQMASRYKTAADVWSAVMAPNYTNVVWASGQVSTRGPSTTSPNPTPGDQLQVYWTAGPGQPILSVKVTVAGIMSSFLFNGGFVGASQLLWNSFHIGSGQFALVKVTSGTDATSVSNTMKRDFYTLGLTTIVIATVVSEFIQIGQSFLGVFEAFLALGLVVGIAGLGIISIRSVVERRKEIGMLRAIGFRKRMVLAAFLLENSYVALLGILIGIVLGIDLGYAIATSPGSGVNFVIPWVSLLEIIAFSYGLAVLTTLGSSRRAAQIPPAEALRYTE